MARFFKPLAAILSIALVAGLSAPADARRGRGSDDSYHGHRSGDHHYSNNRHGCRKGKYWSRKVGRCVWRRHSHYGGHHDDGHHRGRSSHH